ncbi:hypothetical protein C5S29_00075 [ANME-1 cluster archaeon GoMg3.2]|nr:hypothetical protein [ANME-1 cluster archaeon GoMg3.2]
MGYLVLLKFLSKNFWIWEEGYTYITRKFDCAELINKILNGTDVRRYQTPEPKRYLILIPKGWTNSVSLGYRNKWNWFKENYPAIARHLEPHAKNAEKRWDKGDYWWELRACDYYDEFEKNKIIWPEIAKESRFTFDEKQFFLNKTCFFTPSDDLFLLGLLNSKIIWFYLKHLCAVLGDADKRGRLLQQKIYIEQLPIHTIDFSNSEEVAKHDKLVALVGTMLELQKKYHDARMERDKELYERQIKLVDAQIDGLVYDLYGLTDEEIEIVEKSL